MPSRDFSKTTPDRTVYETRYKGDPGEEQDRGARMPEENDPYHATWPPSIEPEHDPLCPVSVDTRYSLMCSCLVIAKVRADEREQIVKALEARRDLLTDQWQVEESWAVIAFTEAIRADEREKIARAIEATAVYPKGAVTAARFFALGAAARIARSGGSDE